MAEIKQKYYWKENPDGTRSKVYFYPVTSAKAVVIDSEGNTLDEKLEELEESGGSLTAEQLAKIAEIDNKVDKVSGKGLSSNDYTNADKSKLDGIDMSGKQDVISDLAAIRSGAALGASALQSHQDISNLATKSELNTLDLQCGDLSELTTTDKTTLVKAVNEANSKASEKYSKPSGGIPSTDLASAVQTSLGKADSALQEHQTLKTINNESIVGEGNISIQGGGDSGFMLHGTTTITEEVNSIDIDIPDSTEIYVYLHFIGTSSNTKNGGFRLMLNHNSLTQYRLIDSSDGVRMLATQQRNSTFFAKAIDKNTIFALWSKNATTISECCDGTYSSMNVGSYISIGEKIKKIYVYAKDSQVFGVGSSITIYRKWEY